MHLASMRSEYSEATHKSEYEYGNEDEKEYDIEDLEEGEEEPQNGGKGKSKISDIQSERQSVRSRLSKSFKRRQNIRYKLFTHLF